MIFNVVSGGVTSTITVNTAAGASVTCALPPFSYSATANSSGVATFTVHANGTWTCTSSKNGLSANGTVSITASGQNKSVTLSLRKWLFKEGEGAKVTITEVGSRTDVTSASIRLWSQSTNNTRVYTASDIDLSKYSKVVMEYTDGNQTGSSKIRLRRYSNNAEIKTYDQSTSRTTVTTSISSITYTDKLELCLTGLPTASHYVYNWYLEV